MSGSFGLGRAAALACALMASSSVSARHMPVDQCRLELASRFVGARAVPSVRGAIRNITRPVRWIVPGRAIKPDFQPKRLNVILDETGRILNMRCG